MDKPLLPIGIDNFYELINHRDSNNNKYLFVDKSILIRDYIDASDKITLITRPRRFGKTINMPMLQYFLSKEVNGVATQGLFDGLEVSKYPEVMSYQGKYPVIFLTLKEIRGKDFKESFNVFKETFRKHFESHSYLLESNKISLEQKTRIKRFISQEATFSNYQTSLQFLSNLLYQETGEKAIILLDEYDTPLHDAYINEYYEEMRNLIATMFNKAFKGNNFLFKAIITGIMEISKSSLFSELNNVSVYSILSSRRFGFTEEETDDMLKRSHLPKRLMN